jgi:hypothetical protein
LNLYKELHDPIRGRTFIYEDWRHGGHSSRGKMWEAQIRKTKLEYTDEQRAAFTESRANLYAAAHRLGIELPSKRAAHNAQTATAEQPLSAQARRNTLPTRSSTRSPNAIPTSGIATASGSSRSNAQQLQGGNAKVANKNFQVAVVKASSKPSTLTATQKYKPRSQSAGVIKRKKTLVSNRPSSVHKVTPKALFVRQLNIHNKTTAFNDIHPSAPLLASNKTISRASKLLRVQGWREEQRRPSRQPKNILEGKQPAQHNEALQDDETTQDDETVEDASSANESVESVVVKTARSKSNSGRGARKSSNYKSPKTKPYRVQKTPRAPRSPWNRLSPKVNRLLDDDGVSGTEDDEDDAMDTDDDAQYTQRAVRPARLPKSVSVDPRAEYADWSRRALHDILIADHKNRYPAAQGPHQNSQDRPAEPKELSAEHRVLNFFEHMFGGQHDEINDVVASEKERGREPGQHLQVIYNTLCEELGKRRVKPRYRLSHVFSSPGSPFPNMRLAYEAYGRLLLMLHRCQVNYTGAGATVVCGERKENPVFAHPHMRSLTANEVEFIDRENPVFERGGVVYTVEIEQPNVTILGTELTFNTASVKIPVMLCDAGACEFCSPDGEIDTSETLGLPRIHMRHLGPTGNRFNQMDPHPLGVENEDTGGEFAQEASYTPDDVIFWGGPTQEVVTCNVIGCRVCVEAIHAGKTGVRRMTDKLKRLQREREGRKGFIKPN